MPHKRIEDYGIIGDLHSGALGGVDGSIDWCCLPCFDYPSVFAAILDEDKGGYFKINAVAASVYRQLYIPDTNVLVTRQLGDEGIAEIIDFMPIEARSERGEQPNHHQIVRRVNTVSGKVRFRLECFPAFDYARSRHEVHLFPQGALFESPSEKLGLVSPMALTVQGQGVVADFTLSRGESATFVLRHTEMGSEANLLIPEERGEIAFRHTVDFWKSWISQSLYSGRWREMVHRSALVLKLLTYAPTGAIVAAPTTSLPEAIGGARNWDYRYTWLRDAAFTIYGLLILGFMEEAKAFMGWIEARCHELEENGSLQPMFTIEGGYDLTEVTLDHLEGYRKSGPVRIGNGAYKQQQLDVYGDLLDSIYLFDRHKDISYDLWWNLCRLLNWLSTHWQDTDEGIWEVRGGQRHFVHSRVMSWGGFDRGCRMARHRGLPAPRATWETVSTQIYEEVMQRGWNEKVGSFVQYYGSEAVDASALLMVLTRFTGPTDPRMLRTIDRIQKELTSDSHVYRYNPELAADDGFGDQEGTFSICSFWLVEALARAGRLEEARLVLEKILTYANHVGLYAEEIGPTGEALGNFPQAFTHLSLISACYNMDRALNGTLRG